MFPLPVEGRVVGERGRLTGLVKGKERERGGRPKSRFAQRFIIYADTAHIFTDFRTRKVRYGFNMNSPSSFRHNQDSPPPPSPGKKRGGVCFSPCNFYLCTVLCSPKQEEEDGGRGGGAHSPGPSLSVFLEEDDQCGEEINSCYRGSWDNTRSNSVRTIAEEGSRSALCDPSPPA